MSSEEGPNSKTPKSKIPKLRRCSSLWGKAEFLPTAYSGDDSMDVATPLNDNFNHLRTQSTPEPGMRKLSLPVAVRGSIPQSPTYSEDDNMSVCSTMSCGPAIIPHKPRSHSCVVHCSSHHDEPQQYLTPTQRAQREIKHLKYLLRTANRELSAKDVEIEKLTKELVELRFAVGDRDSLDEAKSPVQPSPKKSPPHMFHIELKNSHKGKNSFTEKFKSETDLTTAGKDGAKKNKHRYSVGNNKDTPARSPQSLIDIPRSLTDSGHFDDLASSSMGSKESLHLRRLESEFCEKCSRLEKKLQDMYEKKLEETRRNCNIQVQDLKEKHNDRVENLLHKLDNANSRNISVRKQYEDEIEKHKETFQRIETLQQEQAELEIKHHQMYLHMYRKGQDAAKFEQEDDTSSVCSVRVSDLIDQLHVTEQELERIKALVPQASFLSTDEAFYLWIAALRKNNESASAGKYIDTLSEAEVTLQFLKSAVYYFLTDKDNHKGHLRAIQSILGFSELEKINIDKATKSGRRF